MLATAASFVKMESSEAPPIAALFTAVFDQKVG